MMSATSTEYLAQDGGAFVQVFWDLALASRCCAEPG